MALNENQQSSGRSLSPEIRRSRSHSSEEKVRDLPSLPSVPTTNLWEPVMAANKNQPSGRSVSPEMKGSRSRSSEEILINLERTLAMLRRDDEITGNNELCSSRTCFMPQADTKEKCSTSDSTRPLPADRQNQNIKQEENSRMSARIKSEPGLHAVEVSEGTDTSQGHQCQGQIQSQGQISTIPFKKNW